MIRSKHKIVHGSTRELQFVGIIARLVTMPPRRSVGYILQALTTLCIPCLTFGQIAEILDLGKTSCGSSGMKYCRCWMTSMPCLMSCTYRAKLRALFGLAESPCPDWVTHCCCEYCALCQEYRELKARGIDPSTGWLGNSFKVEQLRRQLHQQQQPEAMMPPMNQTMRG